MTDNVEFFERVGSDPATPDADRAEFNSAMRAEIDALGGLTGLTENEHDQRICDALNALNEKNRGLLDRVLDRGLLNPMIFEITAEFEITDE